MTDAISLGYAESSAPPPRQEIIYRDRDGALRLIVIPATPSIDELVAIVRDARFHPPPFVPRGRPDGNGPGPRMAA